MKQVASVGLSLFNYQDDARSNKHKTACPVIVNLWEIRSRSETFSLSNAFQTQKLKIRPQTPKKLMACQKSSELLKLKKGDGT